MAHFDGSWDYLRSNSNIRTNTRHYGSTVNVKNLLLKSSGISGTNVRGLDDNGGNLINLYEQSRVSQLKYRSSNLPPIDNKNQQQYVCQGQKRDFSIPEREESPYCSKEIQQSQNHRTCNQYKNLQNNRYGSQGEEHEGETSGYASDSIDIHISRTEMVLPRCKPVRVEVINKTWQDPYHIKLKSALPPPRKISDSKIGELNRPKWCSVRDEEIARVDPPPPSWLARLGHSNQVLFINHENASSSESSPIDSIASNNMVYLRGQNTPLDTNVLLEREMRRQKALELQNAIKKQLEEKSRQKKEEKERKFKEERLEEERIKREWKKEKERFEEEQRKLKEKEVAKLKQVEAMHNVLEKAERLTKQQKKIRSKYGKVGKRGAVISSTNCESKVSNRSQIEQNYSNSEIQRSLAPNNDVENTNEIQILGDEEIGSKKDVSNAPIEQRLDKNDLKLFQVPVSKNVTIVLSGQLDDSEILNKSNLQLVNLILTPTSTKTENNSNNLSADLNSLMYNVGNSNFTQNSSNITSMIVGNKLLSPSKYASMNGRDFKMQTTIENDIQNLREKTRDLTIKDASMKDCKDVTNANKRDIEKLKSQSRRGINSRPQWNANRSGIQYRTQSEKDPHYQRRMQIRRRQVESSDEHSRSPSPDRRKLKNVESKFRMLNETKSNIYNYDADNSMGSLNSIMALRTDKNEEVVIEENRDDKTESINKGVHGTGNMKISENDNSNVWCGQEILFKLSTLKNGLLMKQMEWDSIMAFQLDDLLKDDKKDTNLLPDLSKATCNNQQEFRRFLEISPEFKIKPEKVKKDDAKVRDKEFSWKPIKKELKMFGQGWNYGNPIPPDMRSLDFRELEQVAIDWKMLTPIRPKHRQDDEMFSRLVLSYILSNIFN